MQKTSMYLPRIAAITALVADIGVLAEHAARAVSFPPVQATAAQTPATQPEDRSAGSAPALPLQDPFQVKWDFTSRALPGETGRPPGFTDPIVSRNVLYFGDDVGAVRALNARDGSHGTPLWEAKCGGRILALATDDQRVYLPSDEGIRAIDCINGKPAWNFPITGGASSGGCVLWPQTETLFCGGNDGLIYGLDRRTGAKIWTHSVLEDAPPDPPGFAGASARFAQIAARPTGIVTDGQWVYQSIFDQCRLVALDCGTGKQRWSFQTKGWVMGSAAVNDQFVFIGSQDSHLYCLKKDSGDRVWDFTTRNRIESAPTILGNNVYIASCDGCLYCISIATGEAVWKFQTELSPRGGAAIYSKPIILQDAVYFAAGEGQVYALSAASGQLLWKTRPSPGSQLYTNLATDGVRLFLTSRPSIGGGRGAAPPTGEVSIIALEK